MVSFRYRPPGDDTDAPATVQAVGSARIPTDHGAFEATAFADAEGHEHMAYVSTVPGGDVPLVRLHSECLTGDVLGSVRCDCGSQLRRALEITGADGGMVLYIRGHEGRGIGLGQKMLAYELQDGGLDTVEANHALGHPADARSYDVAAAILHQLGVTRIRLLSNNPAKTEGLADLGIEVVEAIPLTGEVTPENLRYLETKRERMAHTFGAIGEETA
ncbi:MAG: GTP cyclohydrolase II [Actinomycetota bacterium]